MLGYINLDPLKVIEKDLRIALHHLSTNEDKLNLERLHKHTVLDSIDDAVAILDEHEKIVYQNRQFSKVFSPNWEKHSFADFLTALHPKLADAEQEELKVHTGVLDQRQLDYSFTQKLPWKDSDTTYKVFSGPIINKSGKYLGRIWKFEDITEQAKLENMKTEFISIASHQLRSPITAFYGYLQMIQDGTYGNVPENLDKPLTILSHTATQMRSLINDLLDISRLDIGTSKPELQPTDIVKVISEEIEDIMGLVEKKLQHIQFVPPQIKLIVNTDPKLLKEIIKNYLNNAVKYTPQGKTVRIMVDVLPLSVKISIKDEGIGIPTDQQTHMFEKFFRADNAARTDSEGTGLGLYFVKKCATLLKSQVGFSSAENEGSTFWIELPK